AASAAYRKCPDSDSAADLQFVPDRIDGAIPQPQLDLDAGRGGGQGFVAALRGGAFRPACGRAAVRASARLHRRLRARASEGRQLAGAGNRGASDKLCIATCFGTGVWRASVGNPGVRAATFGTVSIEKRLDWERFGAADDCIDF